MPLQVCLTATGVVATVRHEADGDVHVGLRLDPGQESLLNAGNVSGQGGNLVVEVICAGTVTQADAISACASYLNPVPVPELGAHISVTGPYVFDADHGWNEIHPAEVIIVTGAVLPSGPPAPSAAPTSTPTSSAAPAQTLPAQPATATPQPTAASTEGPTAAPSATAPPATAPGASVTFTFVRSPVGRNQTATATVATTPGATCTIRVTYSSGPSSAQGLTPKNADGNGVASWSWQVGGNTTFGSWPIDVTCGGATARAYFVVQ